MTRSRARVTVISADTNQKVFGGGDSTGKTLRVNGADFRVIGVLGPWMPTPRFWDLTLQSFNSLESVFVPSRPRWTRNSRAWAA